MLFDDEARLWQDLQVCKIFTCSINTLWNDSAVFPDFVEYSTAQGRLHLLCNERYGKRTTTLYQAATKELRLMQKIVNLYTHSHNYSITEVRHTTNS